MMEKNAEKSQSHHLKTVFYMIAVVTVAMIIEVLILYSLSKNNANRASLLLLNQVVSIIEENEQNEDELIGTLKEDYIIRAQTVSYILDSKPEAEYDVAELQKIASMMQIDEIHLFDTTGEIYSGTEPKYYGYNFNSGEQMAYFKPMLEDKNLSMCQDVTPNTAEGKQMMYAITWNDAGDRMIQVGIEPIRLLEELRRNEIPEVVGDMPAYEGVNIWVADADSGVIYGATDSSITGKTLNEMGITETPVDLGTTVSTVLFLDGRRNYCNLRKTGDYTVVTTCSTSFNSRNRWISLFVEFVYLMASGVVIVHMVNKVIRANAEKNAQMAILLSMADIYNSMHLIDLENNTVKEYHARDDVTKISQHASGADEFMTQTMMVTTQEKYLETALAFTDIHTIADRMKGKKTISKELISKAIGWYRGSFITIETDGEARPTKVVYVTQDIDKEKKKEEELFRKSNVDELTGLYNRHAYEDGIAERNDTVTAKNFVFVSLDVNGLKKVNDSLGHIAGDELLLGAANCMKQCFGPYGRVYRIGGDEFVAIIFASSEQLESIKKDFADVTAKWSGNLVQSLSVSSGYVTKLEVETTSIHEIANIADKRMYEAKAKFYGRTSN
jgi:diguanylate cyclase (GGDEF)-like protein